MVTLLMILGDILTPNHPILKLWVVLHIFGVDEASH